MHRGIAKRRATPAPEVNNDEIDRHLAGLRKSDVVTEGGAADAAERREDLLSNSGLLLPREGGRAAFYHLSFQEFLAAGRLRRIGEKSEAILQRYAATAPWHRTLRFLFCALADKDSPEAAIDGFKSLLAHLEPAQLDQDPNPALLLADCLEVAHGRKWNLELFARTAAAGLPSRPGTPEPAGAGARLADPRPAGPGDRPGIGLKSGLPDIAWVELPAGAFLYGDKKRKKTLRPSASPATPSPMPNTKPSSRRAATRPTHGGKGWRNGRGRHGVPGPIPMRRGKPSRGTKPWPIALAGRPAPGKGTPAGRPSRAAAHRGRMGESGPRQRRPRIPLGRIRLGARQYRQNLGLRRNARSRANLRRRPLPGRRFPLRRAGYGRQCLGMVPERIRASRAPRSGRECSAGGARRFLALRPRLRALGLPRRRRPAAAATPWGCGWCVWLPSPEALATGALSADPLIFCPL